MGSAWKVNQPHDFFPRDNNQFSRKNKAKPMPLAEDPAALKAGKGQGGGSMTLRNIDEQKGMQEQSDLKFSAIQGKNLRQTNG